MERRLARSVAQPARVGVNLSVLCFDNPGKLGYGLELHVQDLHVVMYDHEDLGTIP
jgi:hypothetical protein